MERVPVRDPELLEKPFLARLEKLVRLARRAPPPRPERKRRFLSRGKGVEVATYRDYAPGEDIRLLDWAAYARLERLYVRVVEEVIEPRLDLIVDASGSMGHGEPAPPPPGAGGRPRGARSPRAAPPRRARGCRGRRGRSRARSARRLLDARG